MKFKLFTAFILSALLTNIGNAQIQNFPAETTPVGADLLYMVKSPGGAGTDRHITVSNLTKGLTAASTTSQGVVTTGTQSFAGVKSFTSILVNTSTSRSLDLTSDIISSRASSNSSAAAIDIRKSRGTIASPIIINNNDQIGQILFTPYDGDQFIFGAAEVRGTVDGVPGDNDTPTRLGFYTTPDGTNIPVERLRIDNIGTSTFFASASEIPLLNLTTATSGDDPITTITQSRIVTTDATVTTVHTIAITANRTYRIHAEIVARRTGGTAGTADDGATYTREWAFTTKVGTVTQLGLDTALFTAEDQASWDFDATISGTNVLLQVTGAINNNVTWHLNKCEVSYVGS